MNNKGVLCGLVVASISMASMATATEFRASTVRALGMGGSNVASTNGVEASYWNPAAYGFFGQDNASAENKSVDNAGMSDKYWGFGFGGAGAYTAFGPVESNVNKLETLVAPAAINQGQAFGTEIGQTISDAASLVNGIKSLDSSPMGVTGFATAGAGVRVSNYGVGVNLLIDAGGTIALDNTNVKLDVFQTITGSNVPAGISATPVAWSSTQTTAQGQLPAAQNLVNTTSGQAQVQAQSALDALSAVANPYFNDAQVQNMFDELTGIKGGMTAEQAMAVIIGFDAALQTDSTTLGKEQEMADNLISLATADGNVFDNKTKWSVQGAVIKEVGMTYGYAFDDHLSVGVVAKFLSADVFALENDILGTAVDTKALSQENLETSTGFGLDLGVMYRMPSWQFGATVQNINAPSFEHSSGYVYELSPQAKVGAAWMPSDEFTLEAGFDLTENQGAIASNKTKYWNLGFEWDAWKVLALRAGVFNNMALSDIGLVKTVGLGLNLWAARLDIAAAISSNKVTVNGSSVPTYASASAALTVDF